MSEESAPKKLKTGNEEVDAATGDVAMGEGEREEAKEPEAPEVPSELEMDPPQDDAPRIKDPVTFHVPDTTMNVLVSTSHNVLMCLSDGGFQYLLAGARASVGLQAGRYMFECKIIENVHPVEDMRTGGAPPPRNLLRVGVSSSSSDLFLGESDENVCFDSEGGYVAGGVKRTSLFQKFNRDVVVAVVLNLDPTSPNANTVSLFLDGVRVSHPQLIPENLRGKPLYPTVSYRNVTVHAHFGPQPLVPLSFQCRTVQDASAKDAVVTPPTQETQHEVLFPVGLPDEGMFDWLDMFLAKNPTYTELSDRVILDWAHKSGLWRPKGYGVNSRTSNDKPEMAFNAPLMDDMSIRRILSTVAPIQNRNYVVMEVKGNLVKEERQAAIDRFSCGSFKKVAVVMIGEPSTEFKQQTSKLLLDQKQEAANIEFQAKRIEERRRKLIEKHQRQLERAKRNSERERQRVEKQEKERLQAAQGAEQTESAGQGEQGVAAEAKETEDASMKPASADAEGGASKKKEEEPSKDGDEDKEEESEEELEDHQQAPKAELTVEERTQWFRKHAVPDLAPYVLNISFEKFSLPEADEGFDQVKFDWLPEGKCQQYLTNWKLERKITTRIEDLVPSDWFHGKWKEWQKAIQGWHTKQNEFRALRAKKAAEKARAAVAKAEKTEGETQDEEMKENAPEAPVEQAEDGAEVSAKAPEDSENNKEAMKEEEDENEEELRTFFDELDIFGTDDVDDIGKRIPLYQDFQFEDWTMLGLRFELHLLAHAFRRDAQDPERTGIHLDHLAFYYSKYYKKALSSKFFGVETFKDLVELVRDAVFVTKTQVIESWLPDSMESMDVFVKLTEEARRDRLRRTDMNDESARLKISQPAAFVPAVGGPPPHHVAGRGGGRRGNQQQYHQQPHQQPYGDSGIRPHYGKGKGGGYGAGGGRPPRYGGSGGVPGQAWPSYQRQWQKGGR